MGVWFEFEDFFFLGYLFLGGMESEDDEDWLTSTPTVDEPEADEEHGKKRQRKVITLDEILEAEHKESVRKLKPRKNAKLLQKLRAKSHLYESTDSEDDAEDYRRPTELLEELEKQVPTVAEEVEPEWGLPVLAAAHCEPPSLVCVFRYIPAVSWILFLLCAKDFDCSLPSPVLRSETEINIMA